MARNKEIELNRATGRWHIVTVESKPNGEWHYIRRTASGLTLTTQDLDYYFHGIQSKGYKTGAYAQRKLKSILSGDGL